VTTERYDRQKFEMLEVAAKKLETGETFKIPSSSGTADSAQAASLDMISAEKSIPIH
jgi:hypothetical protein